MADVTFDITKDLAPKITMTVKVSGITKWRFRVWVAGNVIKMAARIMNIGVKFEA